MKEKAQEILNQLSEFDMFHLNDESRPCFKDLRNNVREFIENALKEVK